MGDAIGIEGNANKTDIPIGNRLLQADLLGHARRQQVQSPPLCGTLQQPGRILFCEDVPVRELAKRKKNLRNRLKKSTKGARSTQLR